MKPFAAIFLLAACSVSVGNTILQPALGAVATVDPMTAADATAWRQCALMTGDREARLNCFDRWANQRQPSAGPSDITPDATLINATKVVAPQPPVTLSPVDITILTPQNMTA